MNHLEFNERLGKLTIVEVGLDILGDSVKKRPISPDYRGLCPFHQEKTPSFYLKTRWNRYQCFGCGMEGSPLSFPFLFYWRDEDKVINYFEKFGLDRNNPFSLAIFFANLRAVEDRDVSFSMRESLFQNIAGREYRHNSEDYHLFEDGVYELYQFALHNPNAARDNVREVKLEIKLSEQLPMEGIIF